ncbi:ribosomal protein S12 methylthiotransferase RimO [Bacteroidia bacterium]|nr:ribosomal protein S12 methylthiotransferase RimO [Bacteroidia bacterium]
MKKINIITLGCSKNVVDSERMALQLKHNGYLVQHNSNESAHIVIINTCGFINDAKQEAIDTILQYAQAKQQGAVEQLFVVGCLSQRYADVLRTEIPEVDEYFGTNSIEQVLQKLNGACRSALLSERLTSTPQHYAYLKIAEGCNWHCSYCAIPLIRGKFVSTPLPQLLHEAEFLAQQGVKELILVAQDLTYYGLDIYQKRELARLLQSLSRIDGIQWLRLHYAYPSAFPLDVLDEMQHNPKICHYLDIPFQHISDNVLKKMRREHSQKDILALIADLRQRVPDLALRTTLLVGHPGEAENDFQELLQFVARTRFERLGVFAYSHEEGTYAASHFTDNIPENEKQRRLNEVMALQSKISNELNTDKIGSVCKVIIDRQEGDFFVARSQYDSPEVDGEILINAAIPLKIGDFYNVKITDSNEYDLFATLL